MRTLPVLALAALVGCASTAPAEGLAPADVAAIRALNDAYVAGWLAGDTLAVLGTLADDVVLQPGGVEPVRGVEAARAFWFPDDGSRTTILTYDLRLEEVAGAGDLAYSRGRGTLTFRYERDGEASDLASTALSMTVYRRRADGPWRIARRMWAPLRP